MSPSEVKASQISTGLTTVPTVELISNTERSVLAFSTATPVKSYGTTSTTEVLSPLVRSLCARIKDFLISKSGIFLLLGAQFFASVMALTTRYLATSLPGGHRFHALQVLFARMGITMITCFVWMWWNSVEHAPFGRKDIRWLLIARGLGGFVGVFGLYS
jgi:hypothetical protein